MKVISGMSRCRPGAALGRKLEEGKWCLVDYSTADFSGTMIWTAFEDATPNLVLPLEAAGTHDIYVGILYSSILGEQQVGLKLSGEKGFHRLEKEVFLPKDGPVGRKFDYLDLVESYWRTADVTGRDLEIAGPLDGKMGCLAYVKLVPSKGGVSKPQRRLIAMTDGEMQARDYYRDVETIADALVPMRDGDFFLVLWGAAVGDACMYETKVGVRLSEYWTGHPYGRKMQKTLKNCFDRGIEPWREVIRTSHEFGLEIYGSMRMMGPYVPPAHHVPGTLYDRHPEFRCRDKEGNPVPHLSLAYPEVRARYVSILREMAEMGADGVHVLFNRGWPWVLYEDITVEEFKTKHGLDPRTLAADDPRWLAHRCGYVTQYLREIRVAMDGVGATQGRRLGTGYHVLDNVDNCFFYGLDVKQWIEEKLVDVLIPTSLNYCDAHSSHEPDPVRRFVQLVKGTSCRVYPDHLPRRAVPEKILELAAAEYATGADGLCFWDVQTLSVRCSEWAVRRELGHRDELQAWIEGSKVKDYFRIVPLKRLVDYPMDRRYWPLTNG